MSCRRKRFKRFFEKDDEPLLVVGNVLGGGSAESAGPKTPKTPRSKAKSKLTAASDDGEDSSTPKPNVTGKKRKDIEASEDLAEGSDAEGNDIIAAKDEDVPTSPSPSPRKKVKPAQEPKTPKSPEKAIISKTTRTPKSTKANKMTKEEIALKDDGIKVEEQAKTGEPEVQAIADGTIKQNERAIGHKIGEPARQAIHDGIEQEASSNKK